jgi:hypothetical protein
MPAKNNAPEYFVTASAAAARGARAGAFRMSRVMTELTAHNTIDLPPVAYRLEMEDASFSHDSVLPLPFLPGPDDPDPGPVDTLDASFLEDLKTSHPRVYEAFQRRDLDLSGLEPFLAGRRGLAVLAVAMCFLEREPGHRLLLAGHTDTSGDDAFNFGLSEWRAEAVHALLTDGEERWVEMVSQKHNVSDYQNLLSYFARQFGWPCDPGLVDDDHGGATTEAVKGFQREAPALVGRELTVDGKVGKKTWGALFRALRLDLAALLGTDLDGLAEKKSALRWVDPGHCWIGCGERLPIADPERDGFRSEANRRVELLFFPEQHLPDLEPHLEGGAFRKPGADRCRSPIYAPGRYRMFILEPASWSGPLPAAVGNNGKLEANTVPLPPGEGAGDELDYQPGPDDTPYAGVEFEPDECETA